MKLLERALSEMKTLLLLVLILFKSVALADAERGLKNYNNVSDWGQMWGAFASSR